MDAATWSAEGQLDYWVKERREWFGRARGRDGRQVWIKAAGFGRRKSAGNHHDVASFVMRPLSGGETEPADHLAATQASAALCLPLGPGSKVQLIPDRNGGHRLHDTPDLEVRRGYDGYSKRQHCQRTGPGFDVIDL